MALVNTSTIRGPQPQKQGLFKRLMGDPNAMSLTLMGLGLLGSKRRSQADRYLEGVTGTLGRMSDQRAQAPLQGAQIRNLDADTQATLNPKPDLTAIQQNLIAAGFTPGTPEFQAKLIELMSKPQTGININTMKWWPNGTYPVDPTDPSKGVTRIRGAPVSGEGAKLGGIASGGQSDVAELEEMEESGDIDQFTLAAAALPDVFNVFLTDNVQKFKTSRDDIADQVGRLRSGGAINEDEQETFMGFVPKFGDSKEVRIWKLGRLQEKFEALGETLALSPQDKKDSGSSGDDPSVDELLELYK